MVIETALKPKIICMKAYKIRLRKSRDNHRPMCICASLRLVVQGGSRDGVSLGTCYLDDKKLTEMHGTAIPLHDGHRFTAQGSIKMARGQLFLHTYYLSSALINCF